MKLTIAATILALSPFTVNAQALTGNQLHDVCEQSEAECNAAIMGMWEGIVAGADVALPKDDDAQNAMRICVPEGVTYYQIIDVMVDYLSEHPENRHYTATSNMIVAFRGVFPCGEAL